MDTPGARTRTRFGPYELRALLGKGGMGEVYEAYDTGKDRVVAVKLLAPELAKDPTYQLRFRRESQATARLADPHVVPINDWGVIDGALFIDMPLIPGTDLRNILRGTGALSPVRAVGIIEQIASALDAAHAGGLVHRDVKPANILVTEEDYAYLADFGVAHTEGDSAVTMVGMAVGSYIYMAPERFDVGPVTGSADIYSLAGVLHETLTGATPFPAASMNVLIRSHISDPPPRPSVHRDGVPAALDEVIARGMAKHPADRYASASELAAAARAAVGGSATPPAQPTLVVRAPAQRPGAAGAVAPPTAGETSMNSVVNPAGPTVVRLTDFHFPPTSEQPAVPASTSANPPTGGMRQVRPFPDAHLFEQSQSEYAQAAQPSGTDADLVGAADVETSRPERPVSEPRKRISVVGEPPRVETPVRPSDFPHSQTVSDAVDAGVERLSATRPPVQYGHESTDPARAQRFSPAEAELDQQLDQQPDRQVPRFSAADAAAEEQTYRQVSDYPTGYTEADSPGTGASERAVPAVSRPGGGDQARVARYSPEEAAVEHRAYREVSDYSASSDYAADDAESFKPFDPTDAAEAATPDSAPSSALAGLVQFSEPESVDQPEPTMVQRFSAEDAEAEQHTYREVSDFSGVIGGGATEYLPRPTVEESPRTGERAYSRGFVEYDSDADERDMSAVGPATRKYPGVRAYPLPVSESDKAGARDRHVASADRAPAATADAEKDYSAPRAYSEYAEQQAYSAVDEYADAAEFAEDDPTARTEYIPVGDYRDPDAELDDADADAAAGSRRGDSESKGHSVVMPVLVAVLTMVVIAVAGVLGWQMFGSLGSTSNTAGEQTDAAPISAEAPQVPAPGSGAPSAGATTTRSKPATLPAGAKECEPDSDSETASGAFTNVASGSSVTSCAFAEEVRKRYTEVGTADSISRDAPRSVIAISPVTGRTYTMKCETEGQVVTCNGGDNAIVYVY